MIKAISNLLHKLARGLTGLNLSNRNPSNAPRSPHPIEMNARKAKTNRVIHKYFVGHRAPDFPLWDEFKFVNVENNNRVGGSLDANLLNHKIFNEYSSLFALRRKLSLENVDPEEDLITIAQYRRFVFNKRVGEQSTNQPWVFVISPKEISQIRVRDEVLPLAGNSYLLGSSLKLSNGILEQYARVHFCRDILRFASVLVDADIISNQDAFNFLNYQYLIPSPSCGTFKVATFLKIVERLEQAAQVFWNNGYKPYNDSYQGRVCSFLLERFNSFLLIRELLDQGLDLDSLLGQTVVVSDTVDIKLGAMSDH